MSDTITVQPVESRSDIASFIELPGYLYRDDPAWVPPLYLERRIHLSRFNPYFRHAEWQAWLVFRNGKPAGRISAQIDHLHRRQYHAATGHFGFFECEDDPAVAELLFQTAEDWLRDHGTKLITGPFNFSINHDCGILVDGFDTPPVIMMPHSRECYGRLIERQGYAPARDLLAYWIHTDFETPAVMKRLVERYSTRVRLRPLDRKRFAEEMETLRDIFNDAWSENWGFVPFTREEFADIGTGLRLFVPRDFIQVAEVDGEPAAFTVVLPNLNEVVGEIDGKLLPKGWLHLIRQLRNRRIRTGRVPLMGVRKRYQNTPMGIALAFMVIDQTLLPVINHGIREVEMSWILEDNKPMRGILDTVGSTVYKRYRIYEKHL
ncbi:MAG: N-acetyltransferase [Gammaproteobacteria bacterium]